MARQIMMPQAPAPPSVSTQGETFNSTPRALDPEFSKHILDVDPLLLAFYKTFCGWRQVTIEESKTVFGKTKTMTISKFVIDKFSRFINEQGANYLFNTILPLIGASSQTSHMKPIDIYNFWKGHRFDIRITLLDSYYLGTYMCETQECNFNSPYESETLEHKEMFGHEHFLFSKNPLQLNIERLPNIMGTISTMGILTMKSKEGFITKEIMENYMTQSLIKQGQQNGQGMIQVEPPRGIMSAIGRSMGMRN
jgi:hypothetical protein